jgi:hypothetical protein
LESHHVHLTCAQDRYSLSISRCPKSCFSNICWYCLSLRCLSGELIAVIGDVPVLQGYYYSCSLVTTSRPYSRLAFRTKIRSDIAHSSNTDPELRHKQNELIREIAHVLRRNIVQGRKSQDNNGEPLYRKYFFVAADDIYKSLLLELRLREETELGDNNSIKNPAPIESSRSLRRKERQKYVDLCSTPGVEKNIQFSLSDVVPLDISSAPQTPPRYYSALKKAHKDRIIPELREEDLEEAFVRGMVFNLLNSTTFFNSIRREWAGMFIHRRL